MRAVDPAWDSPAWLFRIYPTDPAIWSRPDLWANEPAYVYTKRPTPSTPQGDFVREFASATEARAWIIRAHQRGTTWATALNDAAREKLP